MKKWLGAQVTLRTMEWKTYLEPDEPVISCCLGSRGMRRTMSFQLPEHAQKR